MGLLLSAIFFFFNDTATTEIYTLSLHDALPISETVQGRLGAERARPPSAAAPRQPPIRSPHGVSARREDPLRSEEHTSELQSQSNLVCRLLLEKKKRTHIPTSAAAAAPSIVSAS